MKTKLKSREARTNIKDTKRAGKPKLDAKTRLLDMIEALVANGEVKSGKCRHNHHYTVTSNGRILVDGEPEGYIDPDYITAAKYLVSNGYYIRYVRNSPVIFGPDGEATGVTVMDIMRRR